MTLEGARGSSGFIASAGTADGKHGQESLWPKLGGVSVCYTMPWTRRHCKHISARLLYFALCGAALDDDSEAAALTSLAE